ncbi:MAG: integrin alpha [Planctomycetota bacterium]
MHHDDPGGYVEDFGASIAPAGDLDRDGITDVAIGCSEFGFDRGDSYAAELFSGRDGRRLLSIDTRYKSVTVGPAADFDGDGCLDLPIGLPEDEVVFVMDGAALRRRLGGAHRIPIEGSVLLTLRRGSYPSGSPTDAFPALPPPSCGR